MAHKTAALVATYKTSGITQKEFCLKHKIPESTLYYHLSKSRKPVSKDDKESPTGHFFPLHVKNTNPATRNKTRTVLLIHGDIETSEIAELLRTVSC